MGLHFNKAQGLQIRAYSDPELSLQDSLNRPFPSEIQLLRKPSMLINFIVFAITCGLCQNDKVYASAISEG
jgi:hypothetical protein